MSQWRGCATSSKIIVKAPTEWCVKPPSAPGQHGSRAHRVRPRRQVTTTAGTSIRVHDQVPLVFVPTVVAHTAASTTKIVPQHICRYTFSEHLGRLLVEAEVDAS